MEQVTQRPEYLSMVAPFGFPNFPSAMILPFIREIGIRRVHVVQDFTTKLSAETIIAMLEDNGLQAESFHSEFGEHMDLPSDDELVRRKTLDIIRREAEFARRIGASQMVVHASGLKVADDGCDRTANFEWSLQRLDKIADDLCMSFWIENMPPGFRFGIDPGDLAARVWALGSPRLGVCLDTGHAHMRGRSVAEQIDEMHGFVHYIHCHDNDAARDQHLLPFSGTIDWPAVGDALRRNNYFGAMCLEVFEPLDIIRTKVTDDWWQRLNGLIARP
jgi:sugar phosphate isomerase/epimerase